jgi:hypothetical protein
MNQVTCSLSSYKQSVILVLPCIYKDYFTLALLVQTSQLRSHDDVSRLSCSSALIANAVTTPLFPILF